MRSFSSKGKARRVPRPMLFGSMFVVLMLMLVACGTDSGTGSTTVPTPNSSTPTVAAPTDLITPGTLTVGSDTTYPPQEFIDTATGNATGFDIELITAMAQHMGLRANIKSANFN